MMIGETFGGFEGAERSASLPPHHLLWLQRELDYHFDRRDLAGLRSTLEALAAAGQSEGDLQLSLRAQRMRAGLNTVESLIAATDLYSEICSRLAHLSWKKSASFT